MKRALLSVALALCGCSSGGSSPSAVDSGIGLPPGYVGDTLPGTCTPAPGFAGNSKHVGAFCSQGGGQCIQFGGFCSIDVDPAQGDYWCLIQCTADSDCGENACCHADTQNHTNAKACVPILCVSDAGMCPAGI